MKARTLVSILILVLIVLIVIGSCATKRKAVSDEDFFEVWSGTWINTEIKGAMGVEQKIISYSDGTLKTYMLTTDTSVQCEGISIISDKKVDSEGNIWYTCSWKCLSHGPEKFEMGKISDSGNTRELIYSHKALTIEEWDPDNIRYTYLIYYRQ